MKKLDRLGWAAGLSFVSHGVRIGIRVSNSEALQRVALHLPPGSKPSELSVVNELCSLLVNPDASTSRIRRYNLLYWGIGRIARTLDSDEVFHALELLLPLVVSIRAPRKLFVRAAVVGWRGRALLICGPPASGKTLLAEALVRAGATYYSDEYAVFDARGRVHPCPNPRMLDDGDRSRSRNCPVEMLSRRVGTKPLPVGLIVVTQFLSGAHWRPRVLTSGQAVLALLAETVQVRRRPKAALAICRRVADHAATLRGRRGEAEDLAPRLLNYLVNPDHD
jgi:hypothetical protein